MAIGKFNCAFCGMGIVGHEKNCPLRKEKAQRETKKTGEPVITITPVKYIDGSYGANMIIVGLKTEDEAKAAAAHMQRLFCGEEMKQQ